MFNHHRPLIGIVPDYKEGGEDQYSPRPHYALRCNYVEMVNKAGGAAVMLTYDYELIDDYLNSLDGLIIVGGFFDIHPKRYGEEKIHHTVKLNEVRENFEYALGKKALQTQIPFFGICNGMQLLNVLYGGTVIQHIPDAGKEFMDHEQTSHPQFKHPGTPYHEVNIIKDSKLFSIIGQEKIETNSSHHQAAKTVGINIRVSARANDGIIEAIEKPDHPFCIGAQWHPEYHVSGADQKLFEAFVKAADNYKKSKND